jgi:uncharacterized Fe-S cluster protein YjdI
MTTELICANCNRTIESDNINIATDLAKCRHCGTIYKASSLVFGQDEKTLATPPKGSVIEMTKEMGDTVRLFIPKKGLTAADIPQLLFIIFWLGFICFWTLGASQGSILFAMFSIPFWLVGLTMLIGLINSINETQTLTVSKSKLTLVKTRPINGKRFDFNLADLQEIKMTHMKSGTFSFFSNPRSMSQNQSSFGAGVEMPTIISGSGTEYFFESANDAEQDWVTKYLSNKVRQSKK